MIAEESYLRKSMGEVLKLSSPISPSHYAGNGMECIEAMRGMVSKDEFIAHCRLSALKYL